MNHTHTHTPHTWLLTERYASAKTTSCQILRLYPLVWLKTPVKHFPAFLTCPRYLRLLLGVNRGNNRHCTIQRLSGRSNGFLVQTLNTIFSVLEKDTVYKRLHRWSFVCFLLAGLEHWALKFPLKRCHLRSSLSLSLDLSLALFLTLRGMPSYLSSWHVKWLTDYSFTSTARTSKYASVSLFVRRSL